MASNNTIQENNIMRRFTFASIDKNFDISQFQALKNSVKAVDLLKQSGVVNFDLYQYASINYLLIDMESEFNLEQTIQVFTGLTVKQPEIAVLNQLISGQFTLLNRIYKLEQATVYSASEGQLITKPRAKQARFVLTLEIVNDPKLAKEYAAVHSIGKAWPEITANMKTVGIHEMEIYLMGYRAFLIMDTKPDFDWQTDGEHWGSLPREKEWQAHVAKFQKTDPQSKAAEKWKTMKNVI